MVPVQGVVSVVEMVYSEEIDFHQKLVYMSCDQRWFIAWNIHEIYIDNQEAELNETQNI